MVNYQKSKIYKIISPHTDKCYVGSTTKDRLSNRLAGHRSDLKNGKNMSSKYILEFGDYEIVLLELYPCNSKDELHARERHYVETLDCVNKQIPNRSKKEYRLKNKDNFKEYNKEYNLKNKDKRKEYNKEWYIKNKDKLNEINKEYNKVKITCECGSIISRGCVSRHKKTKIHNDLIQSSL